MVWGLSIVSPLSALIPARSLPLSQRGGYKATSFTNTGQTFENCSGRRLKRDLNITRKLSKSAKISIRYQGWAP